MAAVIPIVVGLVAGVAASKIVESITGSKILGAIAGIAAGFGVNSLMSTGSVAGAADTAASAGGGGAVDAAAGKLATESISAIGMGENLNSGVLGDTTGGFGFDPGTIVDKSTLMGANAAAGASTGNPGLLGSLTKFAEHPIDAISGMLPTSDFAKYGLMQVGGNVLTALGQQPYLDQKAAIEKQQNDLLMRQGHYGISNSGGAYTGPDLGKELAAINARQAPQSLPTRAPVTLPSPVPLTTSPSGLLPTEGLLSQLNTLNLVSPSAIAQANAMREQIARLQEEGRLNA